MKLKKCVKLTQVSWGMLRVIFIHKMKHKIQKLLIISDCICRNGFVQEITLSLQRTLYLQDSCNEMKAYA